MKPVGIAAIRNVGLFGHQGAGKTSLTEAMLYTAGAIDRMGRPDDGTATTDFDPEETRRRISINLGVAHLQWHDYHINVVDAPGYLDFAGELHAAMRVVDTAVLVTAAQGAIEVGFDLAWDQAEANSRPRAVIINKMDRENADFYQVMDALRAQYGNALAPVQIPIGQADKFAGVVDLIHMKAYTGSGREFKEMPIPADLEATAKEYRAKLVESAAEGDDALLEKFLDTETLTDAEVIEGLHKGIDSCRVVPVLCGSAARNMGPASLLNIICEAFPNPAELGDADAISASGKTISLAPDPAEHFSALVFKTLADPFVGQLTYFRVYSGTVKSDTHVWNACSSKDERLGQLYRVRGKGQEAVAFLSAGDIGAIAKLAATHTGDTLCEQAHAVKLQPINMPEPIYEAAIVAKSKVDEDKMGPALQRVAGEDPTFKFRREAETAQTIMCGMGDTHLNIVVEKLKKFGATVDVVPIKVPFRETLQSRAEGQGKHKKQSGGRGQYGDCWIKLEPLPRGQGFEFVDAIVGGSVPRQYLPAIEKGVVEAMATGILSGNPMVDVRCTCYDGSYHDVDSSEQAFKMAGIQAFNTVAAKASPVILEPVATVEITVPEALMGDVMSDISGRRGRIVGTEPAGSGRTSVKATVPHAEMLRYAIDLRSLSHGRGTFKVQPSHYDEVPAHIAQGIIAEYQKRREEHAQSH